MPNIKKFNDYMFDIKTGKTPMMLSGLTDSGKVHFSYATRFYSEKPICIVTYNELQAKKLIKDLAFFGEKIEYFPKREIITFDYLTESKDRLFDRISVLNHIAEKKTKIIVTTIEAVMQKMITKEKLYQHVMQLKVGDMLNLSDLKEHLISLGYERYDLVEGKGQFSVRGGIIDIATTGTNGIRIELWGDEIDSIRKFNIMSQRTTEMLETAEIFPAYEFLLETDLTTIVQRIVEKDYPEAIQEKVNSDIEQIKAGDYLNKIDKYFDVFYENTSTLLDYLQEDFVIFLDEIEKIKNRVLAIAKDNENLMKDLAEKGKLVPTSLVGRQDFVDFLNKIKEKQTIYLEKQDIGFVDKQSMHAKRNGYSFSYREVNFFRSSMDLLFQKLQKAINTSKQTIVLRRKRRRLQKNSRHFIGERNSKSNPTKKRRRNYARHCEYHAWCFFEWF